MRVLVTGCAGFIGYHLCEALLARGDDVLGVDNFNDYYPVAVKDARAERLAGRLGFELRRCDLASEGAMARAVADFTPAVVVNLAAQAGVRYSLTHPRAYMRSNLVGFLEVLEACRHGTVMPRLVYASSSSVYGGNETYPFAVTDSVDRPISLYAASKKANELMAHTYSHLYGLQTVGLRFFTVYGPWGRPDMALWIFAEKMLRGEPLPVFNAGKMQRDLTYIDDIVAGTLSAIDTQDGLSAYEVFNLGNDRPENLTDLIEVLADALGVEPRMEMLPMQAGDVVKTWANIDATRAKLGYDPRTPAADGIPRFAAWYREQPALAEVVHAWRRGE